MLKYALLAGALTISAPALAQDMPVQDATGGQDVPMSQDTQADPMQTEPQTTTPAPESDVQGEAQATAQADATTEADPAAQADATTQPATPDQVKQLVDSQFPTYDKDGDGDLTQDEFGEWVIALRSASEPTLDAAAPETQSWVGQAFAQADADSSAGVSNAELTSFLAPNAS